MGVKFWESQVSEIGQSYSNYCRYSEICCIGLLLASKVMKQIEINIHMVSCTHTHTCTLIEMVYNLQMSVLSQHDKLQAEQLCVSHTYETWIAAKGNSTLDREAMCSEISSWGLDTQGGLYLRSGEWCRVSCFIQSLSCS